MPRAHEDSANVVVFRPPLDRVGKRLRLALLPSRCGNVHPFFMYYYMYCMGSIVQDVRRCSPLCHRVVVLRALGWFACPPPVTPSITAAFCIFLQDSKRIGRNQPGPALQLHRGAEGRQLVRAHPLLLILPALADVLCVQPCPCHNLTLAVAQLTPIMSPILGSQV